MYSFHCGLAPIIFTPPIKTFRFTLLAILAVGIFYGSTVVRGTGGGCGCSEDWLVRDGGVLPAPRPTARSVAAKSSFLRWVCVGSCSLVSVWYLQALLLRQLVCCIKFYFFLHCPWPLCSTLASLYRPGHYVLPWPLCITLAIMFYPGHYVLPWPLCIALAFLY